MLGYSLLDTFIIAILLLFTFPFIITKLAAIFYKKKNYSNYDILFLASITALTLIIVYFSAIFCYYVIKKFFFIYLSTVIK